MAAIGGGTVVPTNWAGLIGVAVLVVVIAAATYFGLSLTEDSGPVQQEDELTVQEVFSSSARREVAAAEPVRALSRTDFAAAAPAGADEDTEADWAVEDEAWNAPAEDTKMADGESMPEDEPMTASAAADATEDEADWEPEPMDLEPRSKPAETVDARPRPRAEALVAWWKNSGNGLGVRFAGALDRGGKVSDGVAVMFTEAVSAGAAGDYLVLRDESGQTVQGPWKPGANPTLVLLDGLGKGRYELTVKAGLPAASGQTLQRTVSGPVFVY